LIQYYEPDIVTAQDYYPFGMMSRVALPNSGKTYAFGFGGQLMNNEVKGLGNSYTAHFWEYDSRIGRRWNLDVRPTPGLSLYSAFNNNPILNSDPLGDTIRTYSTAEVTHTTLNDKGGTRDMAQNAVDYKDAHLVPAINKDGQLVGYNVFDSRNKERNMPVLQIEPGDMEEFKRGYNSYMGGARAVYAAGDPSVGVKLFGAGIEMQNYKLMWEGIKKENKDAWSNPVFVVSFLTLSARAGINLSNGWVTARLQGYVTRAAREVDALGDAAFTNKQLQAIHRNPNLRAAFRGNRIDVRARAYIRNDPELQYLRSNYTRGADFVDPSTRKWWDMTTPGQWENHVNKYGEGGTRLKTE
jgi:hypothetical protein